MSDGYTHDPEAFDDEEYADPAPTEPADREERKHPEPADREFDWRGWTLVVAVFVAFVVVPGIIFAYPYVGPALGLTFWDTYLALPMIPAIVLGVLAVWATTRP
jgi:sterol desaturase/sphingolipid hydroxylase (fatty acid hydroxylase superfamily)